MKKYLLQERENMYSWLKESAISRKCCNSPSWSGRLVSLLLLRSRNCSLQTVHVKVLSLSLCIYPPPLLSLTELVGQAGQLVQIQELQSTNIVMSNTLSLSLRLFSPLSLSLSLWAGRVCWSAYYCSTLGPPSHSLILSFFRTLPSFLLSCQIDPCGQLRNLVRAQIQLEQNWQHIAQILKFGN